MTRRTSVAGALVLGETGMKSCTSPTPSGVRKRVIRTFVSGQ